MPIALFGPAANVVPQQQPLPALSDADFFGATASPLAPAMAAPPQAHTLAPAPLSDNDFFGGSPAPAAAPIAAPANDMPSMLERGGANVVNAFGNTITGALAHVFANDSQDQIVRNLREQGDNEAADRYQRGLAAQSDQGKADFAAIPAWNSQGSFVDKAKAGFAALGGQVLGAAASPEGMVTDLPGVSSVVDRIAAPVIAKVAPKILQPAVAGVVKAGATQAVVAGASDPAVQGLNIASGEQKNFDPVQAALAPALGFLVGGTLHGSTEGLAALSDAFRSWRGTKAAPKGTPAPDVNAAPSPADVDAFASSPEMAAFLKSNGITDPKDPRVIQLEDRLNTRRAAQAETVTVHPQDAGGASTPAFNAEQTRLANERDAAASGDIHPAAASTAGRVPRPELPPVMPVDKSGQADTGDLGVKAGMDKFSGRAGLPVATEPQPTRMTPEDVTRSQAKMTGGNENAAEPPPRLITPENRLPQTPQQVQEQRQAGQAFTGADAQRGRVDGSTLDTQPAGRPAGQDAQPVMMDEGFPVQVLDRKHVEHNGKLVEVATVHRYDPRTGELDKEAVPYDVPVRQLTQKNYAIDPRQSQDFAARAEGPGNPEKPRMADQPVAREPDATFRSTAPDPNKDFPGATRPGPEDGRPPEGRSPFPEQDTDAGHFRERSRTEEDAVRDFQARQDRASRGESERPRQEGPRAEDSKTSSKAGAKDADGRYPVDDRGFVASDKGGPMKFGDQKQAAKWIINEGHKKSPDQIFEIENHPSGKGFTVHERGRAEASAKEKPSASAGGSAAHGAERAFPPGVLPSREAPRAEPKPDAAPHMAGAREDIAAAKTAPTKPGKGRQSLFDAIRENGGIRDQGGDVAQIMQDHKGKPFQRRVVNPNGLAPDRMRAKLQEQGWFGRHDDGGVVQSVGSHHGDDIGDLYDMMDREARGDKVFHPDDAKTDSETAFDAGHMRDEEMNRAGITEKDSDEEAAQKLAEFRASEEHDFHVRDFQRRVDDDFHALPDDIQEDLSNEGYEPGSDIGAESEADAGQEEPGRDAANGREADNAPGGEEDAGRNGREATGDKQRSGKNPDREGLDQTSVPGTEPASADELKARADRKDAEERQQNPRAYSGKKQRPADEGLFTDKSEENQNELFGHGSPEQQGAAKKLRDTFYSNPLGDPEVWKDLARALTKHFKWNSTEATAWTRHWENMVSAIPERRPLNDRDAGLSLGRKAYNKIYPAYHAMSVFLMSNDGVMRALSFRHQSETIKDLANLFYAAPRGGRDGAVKETYFEGVNSKSGQWMNKTDELLRPLNKMGLKERTDAMNQIGNLVTHPGAIKPGTPIHDAAAGIGKMLKEIHTYLRAAGVQIGEVKYGFLPRVENVDKIMSQPAAFKVQAAKALMADGMPAKDARDAAEKWLDRVMLGDLGIHPDGNDFLNIGGSGNTPNFATGRSLSKKADDILGDFYHRNPADILPRYITSAVKKAEWSRRFGPRDPKTPIPRGEDRAEYLADPAGKWKDYKAAMIKDGAEAAIPEVVNIIKSTTGTIGKAATGAYRNTLSMARTWSALGYLSRATFSSLSEPVSLAIRTGNTLDLFRAYGNTVRHWVPALRKMGQGPYLEEMAKDLGFIGDAQDNMSMLQRVGNDDTTQLGRRLQGSFFKHVGLTQFTESERVAAMQMGQTFMRRLASDVTTKGHFQTLSKNLFAELGIDSTTTKGGHEAFAKWIMDRDGKPHLDDILEGGDMGKLYHTALGRFMSQSVMHPTGATRPRYAQHPLGSLFYNLQSFNYAFQKNILNRVGSMTMDAIDPKSGLNGRERLASLMPLANLVPLLGIQYALGEIRDQIFPDPAREGQPPKTTYDKMMTAVSRAGLTGLLDPEVNLVTQARYQRDPTLALQGPVMGVPGQVAGDIIAGVKDPGTSNTTHRKLMRDVYDLAIKPTLIAGATALAPPEAKLGMALGAAGIFGISHPAAREAVVRAAAGAPLPPR